MKKPRLSYVNGYKVLLLLFLIIPYSSFSQSAKTDESTHCASNWVFGENAMINFANGQVIPSITPKLIALPGGTSTISNKDGELLFFSNGKVALNSQFDTIVNGDSLYGNSYASQSSIIVPQHGNDSIFFLFTVDLFIPQIYDGGINYSIVEFPNNNVPRITSKNNLLLAENCQKIAAVKHQNGNDYWVVAHGFGDSTGTYFYSYLLTDSILHTTPVITSIGHPHTGDPNNAAGYMKISPDGSKLALAIPADGIVELYDFNTSTGELSNLRTSEPGQFTMAYGVEFSPDNSKIYFTVSPSSEGTNYLYQVEINTPNPFTNPFIVHQFDISEVGSADSLLGALQLGIDGKIYVAKFRRGLMAKEHLGVIYNPDRSGEACNYNYLAHSNNNGLFLETGGSFFGLPNFVSSYLNLSTFHDKGFCHNDTTEFIIRNNANIDSTQWEFDGEGEVLLPGDPLSARFVYDEPGIYSVGLVEYYGGEQYEFSRNTKIHPLPNVQISDTDTIFITQNDTLILDAGDWNTYEWQPGGSTGRYLSLTNEGQYSVTVADSNCCINSDTVQVIFVTALNETNSIEEHITVFPNPFDSKFDIDIMGLHGDLHISISNMAGQVVYDVKVIRVLGSTITKSIDLSALPKGIYLLSLLSDFAKIQTKIIKN